MPHLHAVSIICADVLHKRHCQDDRKEVLGNKPAVLMGVVISVDSLESSQSPMVISIDFHLIAKNLSCSVLCTAC